MTHLRSFLLLTFILINFIPTDALPLDTNVYKYFPLNVGNRWTWYGDMFYSPGPGFETMKILSTTISNNHVYYVSKYDAYLLNGNLWYTANYY
jgi:hypothetical protein